MYKKNLIAIETFLAVGAIVIAGSIMPNPAFGDNAVDVQITSHNQHDTIWATWPSTFDIYIANDEVLGGTSLGHQFWSPDGAVWHWLDVNGWGMHGYVSGNVDSRWGDWSCFDMASALVTEQNIDELGRDTIMIGGVGMALGCPPGSLEVMHSYNFIMEAPADDAVLTMCIDSCFVPPSGAFVFVSLYGNAFSPTVLWDPGGACWPVKIFPYVCGDANFDGEVNIGDILFIISFVFKGGPTPDPYCQADVNDSQGFVNIDDAVYLVNYIFKGGPPPVEPCCP